MPENLSQPREVYRPQSSNEANFHYYTSFTPAGEPPLTARFGITRIEASLSPNAKNRSDNYIRIRLEDSEGIEHEFDMIDPLNNLEALYQRLNDVPGSSGIYDAYHNAVVNGQKPTQDIKWFDLV